MQNRSNKQSISTPVVAKCMGIGAGVALALITLFLVPVNDPDPAWGRYWMVRPMIVVPFAGAMGGLFFYMATHVCRREGWPVVWGYLVGLVVCIIGLWLGFVLGLDGTLWD